MPTISTISTVEVVPDRRPAIDFGLTGRALQFAQLRAANPWWSVTLCAKEAGYSDRSRGAHVRGCELLRDPRVIRAIVYLSSLEVVKAQADSTRLLRWFADHPHYLSGWALTNLTIDLRLLAARTDHLAKVYAASLGQAA